MKAYRYSGKISANGAYVGVPMEDYHSQPCGGPSVSSTGLKRIMRSPAHYWVHSSLNPNRIEQESTKALDLGKAAHCLALEPHKFEAEFVVAPYDDFRSKEAREWRDAETANGKTVLRAEELANIRGMASALRAHPLALGLFSDGMAEMTFAAKDEATGIWMLARPDWVPASPARGLSDYKTTVNAEPETWSRQAFNLGYHIQVGLALHAVEVAIGEKRPTFWMVAQEKEPPYAVSALQWDEDQIAYGKRMVRKCLDVMAACLNDGQWPAYSANPMPVITPYYVQREMELGL